MQGSSETARRDEKWGRGGGRGEREMSSHRRRSVVEHVFKYRRSEGGRDTKRRRKAGEDSREGLGIGRMEEGEGGGGEAGEAEEHSTQVEVNEGTSGRYRGRRDTREEREEEEAGAGWLKGK